MRLLKTLGRGLQHGLVAFGALAFLGTVIAVAANYAVTVGSGTTFGSVVVGGVNYAQQLICDLTTPSQCAAVDTSGGVSVKGEGTAGSAAGGVVTVQGVASMTPVGISAASGGIASGAIASGAVASGAVASGAYASGAISDGADVTLGTKADAAWSSGSGTLVAIAKTIAGNTGAAIPAGTAQIGTLGVFAETAASSGVLKASAGNLFTVSADAVTATTDLKLLLFNSATLPADGTVTPYKCISFKGDGTQASLLLSWAPDALSFTTGISAAVSSATACTTKTNVTATISGQVQ